MLLSSLPIICNSHPKELACGSHESLLLLSSASCWSLSWISTSCLLLKTLYIGYREASVRASVLHIHPSFNRKLYLTLGLMEESAMWPSWMPGRLSTLFGIAVCSLSSTIMACITIFGTCCFTGTVIWLLGWNGMDLFPEIFASIRGFARGHFSPRSYMPFCKQSPCGFGTSEFGHLYW